MKLNQEKVITYKRKIPVLMVPHIWIGAALSPYFFYLGLEDLTSYHFYLSIFFLAVVNYSIYKGCHAFQHRIYSDFFMLAIVPIALPIVLGIYFLSLRHSF